MSLEGIECANYNIAVKYQSFMEKITGADTEIIKQLSGIYLVKLKEPIRNLKVVQNRIQEWLANHPGRNELSLTDEECLRAKQGE